MLGTRHAQAFHVRTSPVRAFVFPFLLGLAAIATPAWSQSGHVLEAIGPVNVSMGGAGTAAPLDTIGALQWNPASIVSFPHSRVSASFEAFAPTTHLESKVEKGAFFGFFPGHELTGRTKSDTDLLPIPSFGTVHHLPGSNWAFGVGAIGIGGFGVDYPYDPTNPITTPQPPKGIGFGGIASSFQMLQLSPTLAYQVTPWLALGLAPTMAWSTLAVTPFPAAPPDNAQGGPLGTYPDAARGDAAWGVGVQAGAYLTPTEDWAFGLTIKSPQWFQNYSFNSADESGLPRKIEFDMDFPMILSVGVAYRPIENVLVAVDGRYIDYANTAGFDQQGFDPEAAVRGFGWSSIFGVNAGIEWRPVESMALRCGYAWNEHPVQDELSFFNVAAPAIIQHHLSVGGTLRVLDGLDLSIAYSHGFEHSITGPWVGPGGPFAGTEATSTLSAHRLVAGGSVEF